MRTDTDGVPKPALIINQFKSVKLFPFYGLDKLLNIHIFHREYFLFQPFIARPDDLGLGKHFRSRELLRDGYYIVRLLLLRNPQETGDLARVLNMRRAGGTENNRYKVSRKNAVSYENSFDKQIFDKDIKDMAFDFDINKAEYITHTDTIVKAQANFLNLYMVLHVTTQQLYYIGSRNLIIIEVSPVDPSGFAFHDDIVERRRGM